MKVSRGADMLAWKFAHASRGHTLTGRMRTNWSKERPLEGRESE